LDDFPALEKHLLVLVGQAHFQDLAAAFESLENVLDVVTQAGDGLADGGQALGLDHGLVVASFLDGHGGLVRNGDGEGQMVLREFPRGILAGDDFAGAALRVEIKHAQGFVPAFHGNTDSLVDAEAHNTLPGIEALVAAGIGYQDALLLSKDILDDGAAQGDLLLRANALAPAHGFRFELARVPIAKHDATSIRLDGADDQLHDPLEKLVQVKNVADGLDGPVHDAQAGQSVLEP